MAFSAVAQASGFDRRAEGQHRSHRFPARLRPGGVFLRIPAYAGQDAGLPPVQGGLRAHASDTQPGGFLYRPFPGNLSRGTGDREAWAARLRGGGLRQYLRRRLPGARYRQPAVRTFRRGCHTQLGQERGLRFAPGGQHARQPARGLHGLRRQRPGLPHRHPPAEPGQPGRPAAHLRHPGGIHQIPARVLSGRQPFRRRQRQEAGLHRGRPRVLRAGRCGGGPGAPQRTLCGVVSAPAGLSGGGGGRHRLPGDRSRGRLPPGAFQLRGGDHGLSRTAAGPRSPGGAPVRHPRPQGPGGVSARQGDQRDHPADPGLLHGQRGGDPGGAVRGAVAARDPGPRAGRPADRAGPPAHLLCAGGGQRAGGRFPGDPRPAGALHPGDRRRGRARGARLAAQPDAHPPDPGAVHRQ